MVSGLKIDPKAETFDPQKFERAAMAMEVGVDGVWDWKVSTNNVYFDQRYYTMAGYEPFEFPGKFEEWEKRVHPDDLPDAKKEISRCFEGETEMFQTNFRFKTKEGPWIWLSARGKVFKRDEKGYPLRMLGTHTDISELKRMEKHLLQSQKMQAIGTLAGGIAHDFNNILSAMMGYAELCQMQSTPDSKITGHLDRVIQAGQRAGDLVNQILTFSRQEEPGKKPVQVNLILQEALKLLRASIPATIEFEQSIAPNAGVVLAEPTRVHQIIMNLCSNSAHAMQNSGGTLELGLTNYDIENGNAQQHIGLRPGPYIRLTVSDTGHGMDPETARQIFDPYFTTKKQGEGTGLGLSVVHGIVTGINGAIKVYSEPGEGTTFQVYIPRIDADADEAHPPSTQLVGGSETILLIDDEEFVLEMTAELLENLGYAVVPRTSSVEAYYAFQAAPARFDLVISDQTMPKLTGIDLVAKIREIRDDIPVILCTGFSAGIAHQKIDSAGIQVLLNKPVLKHEMAAAIRSTLDNRAANFLPEA